MSSLLFMIQENFKFKNLTIRNNIIRQRKALTKQQIHQLQLKITQRVLTSAIYQRSKRLAIYFPCFGEAGTQLIIKKAWQQKKQVYLPVLFASDPHPLRFVRYTPKTRLKNNRFKIPEPTWEAKDLIKPSQLTLVILPLVAFDLKGNRLGMGGGFYDRSFAFLKCRNITRAPFLLGLAYEFQKVSALKTNHWDIPLNFIVTESCLYKF